MRNVIGRSMGLVVALLIVAAVPLVALAQGEGTTLVLDDFLGVSKWSQSNWADADVDPDHIVRYVPRIRPNMGPDEGESAVVATLHFKPGEYSQGVVLHSDARDWSEWNEFVVELKLVQEVTDFTVKAKLITFPDDRWTEANSRYSVELVPGEWVTLRVPIKDMPDDYWGAEMSPGHWARMKAYAVKVYASDIPETSEPVQIVIARPRLVR